MRVIGLMPLRPGQDRRPRGDDVTADWRNDTEPGNDYTSLGHTILDE